MRRYADWALVVIAAGGCVWGMVSSAMHVQTQAEEVPEIKKQVASHEIKIAALDQRLDDIEKEMQQGFSDVKYLLREKK